MRLLNDGIFRLVFKLDRRLLVVFLIVFVNFLGGTIVLPTLPLYARRHFDAPDSAVTMLQAAYFAAQFLAGPFLGRLSDKYGRLPILIISQIGTFLSFVMLGLAPSLTWLFAARLLDGITGGNVIVAQAYITDITTKANRTRALGLIFAAYGLGLVAGPALGGVLSVFGEQVPFIVGAITSLATVILTSLVLRESLPVEERLARRKNRVAMRPRDILENRTLLLIIFTAFGGQFAFALFNSTFALFGEEVLFRDYDPQHVGLAVGLLLGGLGVGQLITQLILIQRLVDRFGERWLVVLGALLRGFSLLSLLVFRAPWLVGAVSMVAFAIGAGIMMPSLQSLTTTSVSEKISGGVLGVYQSGTSLGLILGSAIAGMLFDITPTTPYIVGGLMYLVVTIPAVLLLRRESHVVESPATA